MAKLEQFIIAQADGTYGMANNLVGQLLAILQNDPQVTVISDTNPANTAMRVVVYQVAGQLHYFRFEVTSATQLTFKLMNLANGTALTTGTLTVAANTNYRVQFLWSTKVHACALQQAAGSSWLALDVGDPQGWYFRGPSTTANLYFNWSDVAGAICAATYGALGSNGTWLSIPMRFTMGGIIRDYFSPYAWYLSELTVGYFYVYGGYNYLMLATNLMVSDQVS